MLHDWRGFFCWNSELHVPVPLVPPQLSSVSRQVEISEVLQVTHSKDPQSDPGLLGLGYIRLQHAMMSPVTNPPTGAYSNSSANLAALNFSPDPLLAQTSFPPTKQCNPIYRVVNGILDERASLLEVGSQLAALSNAYCLLITLARVLIHQGPLSAIIGMKE
ncbi:hypothetical protein P175DRAFT_0528196 [Aspergillus ochraceoroseus IBT 24754]|uniref:Uncharacterized protein n=1 Tax=Aspergillus ochraceoroseus IBT 24754 TaxID=1392256 RepID=A0A2T5M841_9EURO|nr:uncharacterized protein P175DRAFT_0528196 [Aspergillus ochraceoroseus IBT 24754]PTU24697.1 hypothetical protein P175DRAFT_0528196 [Aspergillus ochraceoroseus IBT 24754]